MSAMTSTIPGVIEPDLPEPWDAWEGEPARAFEAFIRYRDLPAARRSIRNAAATACGLALPLDVGALSADERRALEARTRAYERYSAAWSWPSRVKEWDHYQDVERIKRRDVETSQMVDRQAELGRILQGRAMQAMQATVLGDKPSRDRVLLAFAVEGARLERLAYGLAADDPTGLAETLPQDDVVEQLSDPEVAAAAARFAMSKVKAGMRAGAVERAIIDGAHRG